MRVKPASALRSTLKYAVIPVTAAAALAGSAVSAIAGPVDTFFASGRYTYCDAKLLARFWGETPWKAKHTAGRMIQRGQGRFLPGKLAVARRLTRNNYRFCNYTMAYQYNDAVLVARYWRSGVGGAKDWMGKMLYLGRNWRIRQVIRLARLGRTYQ